MTVHIKPEIEFKKPEAPYDLKLVIDVSDSVITIDAFISEEDNIACFSNAYGRALDMARAVVETCAYKHGDSLNVAILQWSNYGSDDRYDFRICEALLEPFIHSMDEDENFRAILGFVCSDSRLILAVHDLVQAIGSNHLIAINCARAIEGLRHIIAPSVDDASAWEVMRTALNIDKDYIRYITRNSVKQRHGNRERIEGKILEEILKRSWLIMDRFFELKLAGVSRLNNEKFPLLTD